MTHWWPRRLGPQLILVAVAALVVSQALITPAVHSLRFQGYADQVAEETVARVAAVAQILMHTPAELHAAVLDSTVSRPFKVWLEAPDARVPAPETGDIDLARALIDQAGGAVTAATVERLKQGRAGDPMIRVSAWLGNGDRLGAQFRPPDFFGRGARTSLQVALGVSLITALIMWLILQRLTQPLERLTRAADALGRSDTVVPLPEAGPADVRETIAAFNRMQLRIQAHMAERTRLLASVSHDLRTPITALRLQAEFVTDADQRARMQRTLGEMQAVTESALTYLSQGRSDEPVRLVDLAALIDSVVEDLRLLGHVVEFEYQRGWTLQGRTHALRRALHNLIENAVLYGERATVRLERETVGLAVVIDDVGPGIPSACMADMMEPFARMEGSRNRHTGGHGLGLAIARDILDAQGGSLELSNRRTGGLSQRVRLSDLAVG